MKNNTVIGTGLVAALDEMVRKGNLAVSLRQLLALDDAQLEVIMRPILSLMNSVKGQDIDKDNGEHLRWVAGLYERVIDSVNAGDVSWRMLQTLDHLQREQHKAVGYLPVPFRGFQQVGAIILMATIGHARLAHDLSQTAIRWEGKLGKPVLPDADFLKGHPFMMPVAFCAGKWMYQIAKNPQQYYGCHPALHSGCLPDHLVASCEKWPMESIYAFCPVPSWAADHSGEAFWLEHCTWPEQQAELLKLQRRYPNMTVRFARLHELAFIDLSLRLATLNSPMGIYSFRCENPVEGANCLTYGGVDDSGAQIKQEGDSANYEHKVLPLLIIESEKKKK